MPTIVSLIEKKVDTSIFYSFSEEELTHKDLKEIKADFKLYDITFINFANNYSNPIFSKVHSKCIKPSVVIFSPPPNSI
jgi:hypothetical protein